MHKLSFNDYLLFTVFLTISVIFIFFKSPLGKLYLPMNSSYIEHKFGIKLDPSFQMISVNEAVINILVKNFSPHILSVIFLNKSVSKQDIIVTSTPNEKIKNFLSETGLSDVKIFNCRDKIFYNNSAYMCDFIAEKNELNFKTFKEGSLAILFRKSDAVFFSSVASLNAYNSNILISLLERISKK